LNIEADQLAKMKLALYTMVLPTFHIPWSQGVCYTGSDQVDFLGEPYVTTSMDKTGKNNKKCHEQFGIR